MESNKIESLTNINLKELKFSSTKKTNGFRFLEVFYNTNVLQFSLPKLKIVFDCKLNNFGQLELILMLNSDTYNKFKEFDEQMLEYVTQFNGIEEPYEYTPIIKENPGYNANIRLKFDIKNEKINTVFQDKSNQKIEINSISDITNLLKYGSEVKTIITCVGVWLKDKHKFGVTLKINKLKLYPKKEEIKPVIKDTFLFESDDEIDNSDVELMRDEE